MSTDRDTIVQPAEWAPHDAVWLAWPSHEDLWGESITEVRASFVALARAIADVDEHGTARGERIELLVPDDTQLSLAREALHGLPVRYHGIPFGDIWLRDTAPVFMHDGTGAVVAVRFGFNGWGNKYVLPHDNEVSERVAGASGLRTVSHSLVLEGGSIESDGEGTLLTSRQCLLNPNRNPTMSEAEISEAVLRGYGGETLLWVGDGLLNDHTDGHIDTIARYVAPGVIAVMDPVDGDPNADILRQIRNDLTGVRDARGRTIEVVGIPSPGAVLDEDGEVMPASHLNFYIGNRTVIVPTYKTRWDDAAVEAVAKLFPNRRTIGIYATPVLEGGGAFHCISQQQPSRK